MQCAPRTFTLVARAGDGTRYVALGVRHSTTVLDGIGTLVSQSAWYYGFCNDCHAIVLFSIRRTYGVILSELLHETSRWHGDTVSTLITLTLTTVLTFLWEALFCLLVLSSVVVICFTFSCAKSVDGTRVFVSLERFVTRAFTGERGTGRGGELGTLRG